MKFFMPATDVGQSEFDAYNQIIDNAISLGYSPIIEEKIIHEISHQDKEKTYFSKVGHNSTFNNDLVFAILKCESCFLLYTLKNGCVSGEPLSISKRELIYTKYFD